MNISLLNSLCYTLGWFWCVLLGVHGQSTLALFGAVFLIVFQLYWTKIHDVSLYIQDQILVYISIPAGALLEFFFIQTSIIHYASNTKIVPPVWIICLYPLFVLLLNHSLKIIKNSPLACFLFGFLGAPLSYIAGGALGGLTFSYPMVQTWVVIGICWGLLLCFFYKIAKSIEKATIETLEDRDSKMSVELLYDGECPICKREITMLQKKGDDAKIKFFDISSPNFSSSEHCGIDYNTAMSQIHAIKGQETLLVGISAFAVVYARCQLLVTSTLLRLPFLKRALEPLYVIFAKNRLWITGRMKRNEVK